ncbi:DUF4328 domain-containing protein [Streptomyces olivochromogenes]|uniref:DUF4328 domain-containing protein n=1 Tax=Streptomyces olivochromogenes TaxID=1963 RepID=UPI001F43C2E2|nr:DUF4328 domain-containing protein [Streptomyces olivochromogenes]MCF3133678.1 DUF4328 domain-containing protein [Streptomyces olivochromogenes]
MLAAYAMLTVATGVAAWHKYQVLQAPPLPAQPDGSEVLPLLNADIWFGNLRGWWSGATLVSVLVFSVWMSRMRDLAELVWPEGQRRSRGWLFFGWVVPIADLFVLKMFVNDLWAASRPALRRKRGHPLLTFWWLSVLAAGVTGADALSALKHAHTAGQTSQALQQVMESNLLYVCAAALSAAVVWQLSGMLKQAVRVAPAS